MKTTLHSLLPVALFATLIGCGGERNPESESPQSSDAAPTEAPMTTTESAPMMDGDTGQVIRDSNMQDTDDSSPSIAVINDRVITERDYTKLIEAIPSAAERDKSEIVEELVRRELIMQDAASRGLDKDAKILQRIEHQRQNMLIDEVLQMALAESGVNDDMIRARYDQEIATLDQKEHKARHILVESEEEAQKLIDELNGGADFVTLAMEHSTDSSAPSGGDLGWFSAEQMVQPFADAVRTQEKGSYSKQPIESQFGWHVILKEDERKQEPVSFEQVKSALEQVIRQEHISDYIKQLRSRADVQITQAADATPE